MTLAPHTWIFWYPRTFWKQPASKIWTAIRLRAIYGSIFHMCGALSMDRSYSKEIVCFWNMKFISLNWKYLACKLPRPRNIVAAMLMDQSILILCYRGPFTRLLRWFIQWWPKPAWFSLNWKQLRHMLLLCRKCYCWTDLPSVLLWVCVLYQERKESSWDEGKRVIVWWFLIWKLIVSVGSHWQGIAVLILHQGIAESQKIDWNQNLLEMFEIVSSRNDR